GGYINFLDSVYPAGIKVISSNITRDYFPMAQDYYLVERIDVGSEDRYIETTIFSKLNPTINFVLNGATTAVNNISWTGVSNPYGLLKFSTANNINIGDGIILGTQDETKIYDRSDKRDSYSKLKIKFQEHPRKSFTFYLKQKYAYRFSQLGPPSFSNYFDADYTLKINVNYKPDTLIGSSTLTFNENYNKSFVNFNADNNGSSLGVENSVPGLNFGTSGAGIAFLQQGDILEVNGARVTIGASGNLGETQGSIGTLGYKYKAENGKLRLALTNWGVLEPSRTFEVKVLKGGSEAVRHTFTIQAPKRVEGNSRLTLREYYSINDYIAFNGVALDNPLSLALENNLRDVTLESSTGAGIITMLQGDILDINGVQNQIGVSGNLGEKETTIDTLRFVYKVEAGKLRVKVLDWGVLEPRRDIRIKVKRGTNEISIHTLNIKSPTKVEGDTSLKFDNTYQIRSFAKFKGINLSMPEFLVLERHQGVNLEGTNGAGIPYMNQGDKIYISDNFTARRNRRSAFSNNYYEIGASGTLAKQNIKLTNGEVGVQVEGGKLNLALNNWTVNKNVNVRVQIVRGTNQIMDHTFTLKAPDAPFNVISQGVLDFGTIIAGAKNRTAETDVKIEMIKDITDIQFKLNTDSPELYNKNGTTLRARNLQALVRQQANRRYLVKIQGKLDVPENQELGEYSGSLVLEMKIK
ncbi:MAG: hypothetical protein ACRDDH_17220, partial [Cetobacterium sp.]|uniref:hypothetical protein n=1 Tax=Cetobacterium sp. TaxID=2071632 RepID=UPI003EE70F9F